MKQRKDSYFLIQNVKYIYKSNSYDKLVTNNKRFRRSQNKANLQHPINFSPMI